LTAATSLPGSPICATGCAPSMVATAGSARNAAKPQYLQRDGEAIRCRAVALSPPHCLIG
jgi:hypothetical protein